MDLEQLIVFLVSILTANAALLQSCDEQTEYISHEDCHKFSQCSNGVLVTQTCPDGLYFNPEKHVCDWNSDVYCKAGEFLPRSIERGYDFETMAERFCSTPILRNLLHFHRNCNQFYQCAYGKPYALTCPANLLFQPVAQICDYPRNVRCGARIAPEVVENIEPELGFYGWSATRLCSLRYSDSWLLPHDSCNRFYECANNRPVAFDCPENLRFSISARLCDWPNRVVCGSRRVDRNSNVESELETSNVEIELETPYVEIELETPNVESELETPNVESELETPNIESELETPNVESELETPNVESELETPNVESELETPNVEH